MEKKINENINVKENKEMKQNEIVQEMLQDQETSIGQVIVQEEVKLKLFMEREIFVGSNGNKYWSYVVKGKVRGRDVKVDFVPKDKGGYEPLDIVFSIAPTAELIMTNSTMTDSKGNVTRYISYKVCNKDKFGLLECEVKPAKNSDKALLGMIISELKALAEMQQGGK